MTEYYGSDQVTYVCQRCQSTMTMQDLEERGGSVKCVVCGYKILAKTKPPVVRKWKTE